MNRKETTNRARRRSAPHTPRLQRAGWALILAGTTGAAPALEIQSPAFPDGGAIPIKHTCEGQDVSPPLRWSAVPAGTRSLVLIVDDPDAPDPAAPRVTWVHWVLYDLPADGTGIPEGGALPAGAGQGLNDWGAKGYGGPCPPVGRHRYRHKLYALDTRLGELPRATKADVETAVRGHVVEQAELVGTYQKGR